MNFLKTSLAFLLLFGMNMHIQAQSLDFFDFRKYEVHNSEFAAVLYKGEPMIKNIPVDAPLRLELGMTGKLSVSTVKGMGKNAVVISPVGFKLAVKSKRTNSMWLYSEKTFHEVELEEILKTCEWGDTLIFISVDQKFRIPRHEVVLVPGC